jgi:murein L,D-transpeptidase YafK
MRFNYCRPLVAAKRTYPAAQQIISFALAAVSLLFSFCALSDGMVDSETVPQPVTVAYPGAYIEIIKSEQLMRIRKGDKTYREYPMAYGRGDRGAKEVLGDKKTPEGIYRIAGINNSERFHLFLRLNYPNVKDAFYGLKNNIISRYEFDKIISALKSGRLPPQDTALGGAIGIHGVGAENDKKLKIHANMNWTEGCIALTNAQVSELRDLIGVGTEVVIKP